MKILLATPSFRGGGIGSYAHEVINSYSRLHEVSVVIGDDSKFPITQQNVVVYKYDCDDLSVKNARNILNLVNEKIKPDVIINSCAILFSLLTPYFLREIQIVTVSHSLKYRELSIAMKNHKYSNAVVALSESCKNYMLKKYRIKEEKISVVYNFVRDIPNAEGIKQIKKNNFPINIVYTGGCAPAKSPEIVFKTIKGLVKTNLDFRFYWIGGTAPTLQKIQPFNSIRQILPKDKRIILEDRLEKNEAERLIANANVFFAPSKREGCPMALLEAMRVGTIALVADYNVANKEIIIDEINGFVINHSNIDEFVERIRYIINNHENLEIIYDNSMKTFQNKLSYGCWEKKMNELLLKNSNEKKRKQGFSLIAFYLSCIVFKLRLKFDNCHLILSEYLYPTVFFFVEFLKSKSKHLC